MTGWSYLYTDGVEDIWWTAEIEWQVAEELPWTSEMATFGESEAGGRCWMHIYLDPPTKPGDTTIGPVTVYGADRPFDQLLQVGAKFRLEAYWTEPAPAVIAQGRIVSVQRSADCLPGSHFHFTLVACQMPTEEVMRQALAARQSLSRAAGDYISYLAGFTHYEEASPCLPESGLSLAGRPPRLIDTARESVHFKIVLQNAHLPGLERIALAQKYGAPIFNNRVRAQNLDGSCVIEWPRHPTFQDFLA
jgi:hypothetical protein